MQFYRSVLLSVWRAVMPKISSDRLEKYRRLAERGLWDVKDKKFSAFFKSVCAAGELFGVIFPRRLACG